MKGITKKQEREIEAKVEKRVEKKVEKEVKEKVEEEVKEKVEKEVEKRLHKKLYSHAGKFSQEFRKHLVTAISAAFGFLIALSWREPIAASVQYLVEGMGLGEKVIRYQFVSAAIVTLLAVLCLMLVSKWAIKNESK
jgi:uncharacterized membrane protein YdbT with pleckstrin-like domain